MPDVIVAAMYRFVGIDDPGALRGPLLDVMTGNRLRGTLLLAHEGINGTVAGDRAGIDALLAWLRADVRFADLSCRESRTAKQPFARTRVRLKREIVAMGVPDIDPNRAGTYVEPQDWNALIGDPDVTLIDTRNEYEIRVGTFRGALDPHTQTFRQFPAFVREHLDPERHGKIAMFCTGGIRCEKSTAFLRQQGFDEVYQLKGGVLGYLEEIPEDQTAWHGECFVFDERVTVDHRLRQGAYEQCHACRMPVSADDRRSEKFVRGESCPYCHDERSDEQRRRYRERERQMALALGRGEPHLGSAVTAVSRRRHDEKLAKKNRQRNQSMAGRAI